MTTEIAELTAGPARLRLAPALGGRITTLHLAAADGAPAYPVLVPFPEQTPPGALLHWPKGGLYPLVPYGNRIRNARLRLPSGDVALPAHPDAWPHTLHGHGHRVPWVLNQHGTNSATLTLRHPGGGEWPWRFTATLTLALRPHALSLVLALTNEAPRPMPAGIGLHPYFVHHPSDPIGFHAGTDWPAAPDFLAGLPRPAARDHEPPQALPAGDITLYRGNWTGRCTAGRLAMAASPAFGHLVVHRPASNAYLCLEPASHAPDAFNLAADGVAGTGSVVLAPGEVLLGQAEIASA